jgi:mannitol-1-phosphate 5-dehydrogenase
MRQGKIVISGTGCALADFLYNGISFNSFAFKKYLSEKAGDGGLSPGKLVLTEELEKFSGMPYQEIIRDIIGNRTYDAFNVGGPSLVSLIHASQLLSSIDYEVRFYGMAGRDETAEKIFEIVSETPLNIDNYSTTKRKATPFTHVLSDPNYDNGHGERTFINNIGAAWEYTPGFLYKSFFNSHIVCFGGTALVPQIHDNLTALLARAKKNNCITLVNTVFDFRNEKRNPAEPWPLGKSDKSYGLIDVLIMDREETLRISGQNTIEEAAIFFTTTRISSFIITNGANNIYLWSGGGLFEEQELVQLPVSKKVTYEIKSNSGLKGDTTGCGDNFAGGIIASLAWQLKTRAKGQFNLIEALSWGVASGGFTCFTIGGMYLEKTPGEKLLRVQEIQRKYLKQIGNQKNSVSTKKLVLFGAGKIGRSFIGQLFSRGGYEVVFVDVNEKVIDELNSCRTYNVILKSDAGEEILKIQNVRGVYASNEKNVVNELATAEIAAVSVGVNSLDKVIPLLAKGLLERKKKFENSALDIIIAENMRKADEYFRNELVKYLPENYPINELVGLVETSIGKMVPIMQKKHMLDDILQIFAEPYNTLILNKKAFRNPVPDIKGLAPKENMKAWVDRKSFIHNLGHSAAAYIGYLKNPEFVYLYEALAVPEVYSNVRATMKQAADILVNKYPAEFTIKDMDDHINDLLFRFQNKALGDTIFRVGCDLMRKLGPEDRIAGAIRSSIEFNLPYDKILYALICGCHFRARDEDGYMLKEDVEFVNQYQNDIKSILTEVCGFDKIENKHLFQEAEAIGKYLECLKY